MNMPSPRYKTRYWEDVVVGETLPPIQLEMTMRRALSDAAATRDFFPGHLNPDFARGQGMPGPWTSVSVIEGLLDRIVTDWAGPEAWIRKRQLRINRLVYMGTTIEVTANVEQKYQDSWGNVAEIPVSIHSSQEPTEAVTGRIWLLLPSREATA